MPEAIDWRALLSHLRVDWIDRGRNCAKGRVNINCPYCFDDPSYHLTISEASGSWHCYRDPGHWGNPHKLVKKLCGDHRLAWVLLDDYALDKAPALREVVGPKSGEWEALRPAWESDRMLDYLAGRGFDDPAMAARVGDLRYAPEGKWAARLLFPLYDWSGMVKSWTGRDIRAGAGQKYLSRECPELGGLFSGSIGPRRKLILVEGPIDALKINVARWKDRARLSAIGANGKALTPERLLALKMNKPTILGLSQDADIGPLQRRNRPLASIREALRPEPPEIAMMGWPKRYKDPGAMPLDVVQQWLAEEGL